MTNSMWVHWFISLTGSVFNHISSHDQLEQDVSDTTCFVRQSHQSCLIPWPTESKWPYFISLLGCPINHVSLVTIEQRVSDIMTGFISLPGSLGILNHVSSCDQQVVRWHYSILWQIVSSIIHIPQSTGCVWHFFISFWVRKSHQSCLILEWPTESEWCCLILWQASHQLAYLMHDDQQRVSDTALFLCQ